MNTTNILNNYISIIRSNYELSIFDPETSNSESSNNNTGTTENFDNRAKAVIEDLCKTITDTSDSIFMGFDILFNSHKIQNGENQNFMVINAFSENYRNYDYYNNQNFTEDKTYTYCCGKMYNSSAIGTSGDFLKSYKIYIDNTTEICLYYQSLYDKFSPVIPNITNDNQTEPIIPPITQFWNLYIAEFTTKINTQKTAFNELKTSFGTFETTAQQYIDLGQSMATAFAVGSIFIDSDNKKMVPYNNMGEVWKSHENKFLYYSEEIENIYKIWLTSKEETDKLIPVDAAKYEYESLRQKIFYSMILTYKNFWNQAKSIDTFVSNFIEQYQF